MLTKQVDDLIELVAKQVPFCADAILDLRPVLVSRQHPGKCVSCFFRILAPVSQIEKTNSIAPLKNWLGENLEGVCQKVMAQIHYDQNYASWQISVHFAYEESKAA